MIALMVEIEGRLLSKIRADARALWKRLVEEGIHLPGFKLCGRRWRWKEPHWLRRLQKSG